MPYTDAQFDELIADQRKPRAWTDNNGTFVEASCLCLNIQLNILIPSIPGPVMPSGLGGPLMIVNKSVSEDSKPVFFMGLLKDNSMYNGHYQFLKKRTPSLQQRSREAGEQLPHQADQAPRDHDSQVLAAQAGGNILL